MLLKKTNTLMIVSSYSESCIFVFFFSFISFMTGLSTFLDLLEKHSLDLLSSGFHFMALYSLQRLHFPQREEIQKHCDLPKVPGLPASGRVGMEARPLTPGPSKKSLEDRLLHGACPW